MYYNHKDMSSELLRSTESAPNIRGDLECKWLDFYNVNVHTN